MMSAFFIMNTLFALTVLQSEMTGQTVVDTDACAVSWFSRIKFSQFIELELSPATQIIDEWKISVSVECSDSQAEVTIYSSKKNIEKSESHFAIYLAGTPENMKTRTLALAVADAIKDHIDWDSIVEESQNLSDNENDNEDGDGDGENGTNPLREEKSSEPLANTQTKGNLAQKDKSNPSVKLSGAAVETSIELTIQSAVRYRHPAYGIRGVVQWRRMLLGLHLAGMRVVHDMGRMYGGMAALYGGYRLVSTKIANRGFGRLHAGVLAGMAHGMGKATKDVQVETQTRPLLGIELDFVGGIQLKRRFGLAFRVFGGWMLGATYTANDEPFGEFNSFYFGGGLQSVF
jgi:hypothetical protein